MRLIVLNVWGGSRLDELADFVREESGTTDIFCFQEVLDRDTDLIDYPQQCKGGTFKTLKNLLSTFHPYLTEPYTSFGERLATFVRSDIQVLENRWEILVPQQKTNDHSIGSNLQYARTRSKSGDFLIANVHGFWLKGNNRDTDERVSQSKKIISLLSRFNEPKILCGDFNLAPDTRSIAMLEDQMNNLTKKYSIETTRSVLAEKNKGRIVDYVFVASRIDVRDFRTMDSRASDHLALQLDFRIV
jgi:endonuclease/exonuclease/phosphatase family metal-dependent hydrolase